MFERIDLILSSSGLEQDFINLALADRKIDTEAASTKRLVDDRKLDVKHVWGDRGLASKLNTVMLERRKIGDGFCPRDVAVLSDKLANEPGFREGLQRRAGAEARIEIFKNVFLGRPLLAKGFGHRELAVGWAALTHNLWVLARMAEEEKRRKENQDQGARPPKARAA